MIAWLRITDEGSVLEMHKGSIFLIKSDLKWCIHLSRSLFLYRPILLHVSSRSDKNSVRIIMATKYNHGTEDLTVVLILNYDIRIMRRLKTSTPLDDRCGPVSRRTVNKGGPVSMLRQAASVRRVFEKFCTLDRYI